MLVSADGVATCEYPVVSDATLAFVKARNTVWLAAKQPYPCLHDSLTAPSATDRLIDARRFGDWAIDCLYLK